MATLYRKYRPQNLKEVVGQNHIKTILQNEIQSENIAHAYLFCGPRGVGKTTLARILAKSINCVGKAKNESEPCGNCQMCKGISSGNNFDVVEIDAASNTGVDNVRDNIIASARISPSQCKYKVFIIDEVHMLSISAFNALLKIIEEPPVNVIFILCTTEIHKVPLTIISRCQRFDFKRISISDIVKRLNYISEREGIKVDKKILEDIARYSEGHMRDAEGLLGQIVSNGGKEITKEDVDLAIPRSNLEEIIKLVESLIKKDSAEGIKIINNSIDDGMDLKKIISDLIEVLRKMILNKINPALGENIGIELGENFEIKINELSEKVTTERLVSFIEKFNEAKNRMKESFITQLPIEIAIIELGLRGEIKKDNVVNNPVVKNIDSQENNNFNSSPNNSSNNTLNNNKTNSSVKINNEYIKEKWNEFLSEVKKYNHSLSFVLRVCEPRDADDEKVIFAFKYKFHKDRIDNPEIKVILEKALCQVCEKKLIIETVLDEKLEINENANLNQKKVEDNIKIADSNDEKIIEEKEEKKVEEKEQSSMINNLLETFGGKIVN